jgi:hypothetical protein
LEKAFSLHLVFSELRHFQKATKSKAITLTLNPSVGFTQFDLVAKVVEDLEKTDTFRVCPRFFYVRISKLNLNLGDRRQSISAKPPETKVRNEYSKIEKSRENKKVKNKILTKNRRVDGI